MGSMAAGVISVIGSAIGYFVGGIIEAEEKYHNLEEAIRELTKTRQLLSEHKDRIADAADQLALAARLAQA
jgi:cobyric acid synthase